MRVKDGWMMSCLRCDQLKRVGGCLDHRLQRGEVSFRVSADRLYSFVEDRLTQTPVQIHSKRQYKRLLKENGYTDQIGSRQPHKDLRKKPFDRAWDHALDTAIDQSIAEVKKKDYSIVGKKMSHSDAKQVLKRDYQYQQKKKETAHV